MKPCVSGLCLRQPCAECAAALTQSSFYNGLACSVCFLPQSSSLISSATAAALLSSGAVDYCLHVLKSLLEYWKSQQNDEEPVAASQLLKPHTTSSPPDMSPFFLRQYVKVRPLWPEAARLSSVLCALLLISRARKTSVRSHTGRGF